jgi:hypothetical protein
MSQDQDPIDETRRFEPVDPYNIPPEGAGAPAPGYEGYQPGYEQQSYGVPQPPQKPGFKQRLTRLGPLKLAVLGTAGVIVLGGAAWGTTAALQSSGSSSTTAAAPSTDQSQAPGEGATTGGGKHGKAPKLARVKITQVGDGSFTGTEGKGRTVTVDYGAKTKFGTKAHPLTSDALKAGMTVAVAGTSQGDTIMATNIAVPGKEAKAPASPGDTATPTDPASPAGGGA